MQFAQVRLVIHNYCINVIFLIGKTRSKIGQNQSKIGRVWGKMGQNLEHCQKAEWVKIGADQIRSEGPTCYMLLYLKLL